MRQAIAPRPFRHPWGGIRFWVSYPQALGNKGLGAGTASDRQVRSTPMQVGTTAARPVPPRSCGENRCVDTNGLCRWWLIRRGGACIRTTRSAGVAGLAVEAGGLAEQDHHLAQLAERRPKVARGTGLGL